MGVQVWILGLVLAAGCGKGNEGKKEQGEGLQDAGVGVSDARGADAAEPHSPGGGLPDIAVPEPILE